MQPRRRGRVSFAVMLVGFALLCCVNVACVFPNSLMSNDAPLGAYRAFTMAFGMVASLAALLYGIAAMRARRTNGTVFFASAMVGYGTLACGLLAAFAVGGGAGAELAWVAGSLCGIGIALTMVFWFGMLTFLPERRAMFTQGWQALAGGILFAALFPLALIVGQIAVIAFSLASCVCAVLAYRFMLVACDDEPFPHEGFREGLSLLGGASGALQVVVLPVVGFVVVSFLQGALTAIAMAPEGSPWGGLASSWGGPIGACAFLLWARFSKRRSYVVALQAVLCLIALVLVLAPFDALVFFMGIGYQVCGLLFYSLVIDEFASRRRFAVLFIAFGYMLAHLAFLGGLYVPGSFGVRSYEAFHQSTSLVVFLVYVVFMALFIVTQRSRKRELLEMEQALKRQKEQQEELKRAMVDASEEEYAAVCASIGRGCGLTKRETEVLGLLARGRDVAFICEELYLARNTVKGYTKKIYAKLGVHSKQEIIDLVESARR